MPDGLPIVSDRQHELADQAQALRLALPTERQRRFVEEYMLPTGGKLNATEAALRAGYPPGTARRYANRLLKRPAVRAAVEAARAELAERSVYNGVRMMQELDKAMVFAERTENASAYVRAVELKGKLTGLLVDRVDARIAVGGFSLVVHGLGPEAAGA